MHMNPKTKEWHAKEENKQRKRDNTALWNELNPERRRAIALRSYHKNKKRKQAKVTETDS
jgi:hypothetical protein